MTESIIKQTFEQFISENKFKTRNEARAHLQQIKDDIITKVEYFYEWCSENIDEAADEFDIEIEEIENDIKIAEEKNLYEELFDIAQNYEEFTNTDYQAALEALEFYGMSYTKMNSIVVDMKECIDKGIPYKANIQNNLVKFLG